MALLNRAGARVLRAGDTLGPYRVERLIGRGGMGAVYLALDVRLNRSVALKVLSDELAADPGFRERFRREALAQAALSHPNIVTLYESGEARGLQFLAMRYVRGMTLKDVVGGRPLAPATAVELLAQVADALDAAHRIGIVHRDIKPQNILVEGETAFLADFGLTKVQGTSALTKSNHQLGTIDYMAPEQFKNQPATLASDVYSLAAVAYECLSGRVPFERSSDVAVMYAHLEDLPPPLSPQLRRATAGLDAVLESAMSKRPEMRPTSARELVGSIAAEVGVPLSARHRRSETLGVERGVTFRPHPPQTGGRRRRSWMLVSAVALGVAGAGTGVAASAAHDRSHAAPLAPVSVSRRVSLGLVDFDVPNAWAVKRSGKGSRAVTLSFNRRSSLAVHLVADARAGLAAVSAARVGSAEVSGHPGDIYRGRSSSGEAIVAYVFTLAREDVFAVCRTQRRELTVCERIVGSARFRAPSLHPLPREAYMERMNRILRAVTIARRQERIAVSKARTPVNQAAAALAIKATFDSAARRIRNLRARDVPPGFGRSLSAELGVIGSAYGSLANAARSADPAAYVQARQRVATLEARLARRPTSLPPF